MNKTPRPIQVGDRIRENDPRLTRVLKVIGIYNGTQDDERIFVIARNESNGRQSSIKAKYIYTDGQPRRSGWSLIQEGLT